MKNRLPILALTAVVAWALAAEDRLRTVPVVVVTAVLFAATFTWPTTRLRELTLAATVAIGALSSLAAGLVAAGVAIGIMATAETREDPQTGRLLRRRVWPSVFLGACLVAAIGLGAPRAHTEVDPGDWSFDAAPATLGEPSARLQPTPLPLDWAPSLTDTQRALELSLADDYSADYFVLDVNLLPSTDGALGDLEVDLADSPGDGSPPTQWWLALLVIAASVATLVLSWRIRQSGPRLLLAPSGASPEPDALGWYDRIVEAAGLPRDPSDPVLGHSRHVAEQTGDDRYRQLGRIVSEHAYNGTPFTEADLALIRQLRS